MARQCWKLHHHLDSPFRLTVNFVGVESFFVVDKVEVYRVVLWEFDRAVKAGTSTGVAGSCALLSDVKDEGVLVAVGADFVDFLGVA